MANFSLSDTPWLTEFANPIDNLAKGAQAGAAVAGVSLSKQRLAFEERQVNEQAQERAQLTPFRIAQYLQEREMNTLKLQSEYAAKNQINADAATALDLLPKISRMFQAGADPAEVNAVVLDAATKNPRLFSGDLGKSVEAMAKNYEALTVRKELAFEALEEKKRNAIDRTQTPNTKDAAAVTAARRKVASAATPEAKSMAQEELTDLLEQTAKIGETITMSKDGTTTISRGGKGGLSSAQTEKRTEDQIGKVSLFRRVNDLSGKVNENTVGLKGWLSDAAQIAGQTGAAVTGMKWLGKYKNLERIDFQVAATELASEIYNEWKSDGSITRIEQEKLESMGPQTGVVETVPRALQKIDTLKMLIADRERTSASIQKRDLAIEFMTPQELVDKYKDYEATHPDATPQELEKVRTEFMNAALNSAYLKRDRSR